MAFVSSPSLSDLWCHLNLEAHTQSVCSMSHTDRVTSYVTLRDCVFVCVALDIWDECMNHFIFCMYLGRSELEYPDGPDAPLRAPIIALQFFFLCQEKGYLGIKEIHPSYSDSCNSLCVFIRRCCFISHNSSSQGKENPPKGYRDWREI